MSFFERPGWGESAVLVHCNFAEGPEPNDLDELRQLAGSAGAVVQGELVCSRKIPTPKFLIGSGALDSLSELVASSEVQLVIFNHDLSPAQGRNLEKHLGVRVVDRTGLILDIFAQRARTYEGKLQVELAQLKHLLTRLVRGWTHLERQKGGIGLRGPGETQLESDRRLVRARIDRIEQRLKQVRKRRAQSVRARVRSETPLVAFVGYTNVGKSTLFNALTRSAVYAADQLFATLDTTHRKIEAPGLGELVISDTVGFMRNLPHHLVQAFRSTLEEVAQASLIVEVVDASERGAVVFHDKTQAVADVIHQLGATQVPRLRVYNKIDLTGDTPRIDFDCEGRAEAVWVSASSGLGLDELIEGFLSALRCDWVEETLFIKAEQGGLRAAFYRQGAVLSESVLESGETALAVRLPAGQYAYIMKHFSCV